MMKGQKTPEETKRKMSLAAKGRKFSAEHRKHLSEAQKKRPPASEATRKKISLAFQGAKHPLYGTHPSPETLRKMSESRKGKYIGADNPTWKGDDVAYGALHTWVARYKGQPDTCEGCGESGFHGHEIQWANIDHKYRRVLEDYIRFCSKCHYEYDVAKGFRVPLKGTGSNGHKRR